jgi:hypothetical protein
MSGRDPRRPERKMLGVLDRRATSDRLEVSGWPGDLE